MRTGMVALFAEDQRNLDAAGDVMRHVQGYGLPLGRHVASSGMTPQYVVQLVQQLDATFARLVYVSYGPPGLHAMMNGATTNLVIDAPGESPEVVAQSVAKAFALDDTVALRARHAHASECAVVAAATRCAARRTASSASRGSDCLT